MLRDMGVHKTSWAPKRQYVDVQLCCVASQAITWRPTRLHGGPRGNLDGCPSLPKCVTPSPGLWKPTCLSRGSTKQVAWMLVSRYVGAQEYARGGPQNAYMGVHDAERECPFRGRCGRIWTPKCAHNGSAWTNVGVLRGRCGRVHHAAPCYLPTPQTMWVSSGKKGVA